MVSGQWSVANGLLAITLVAVSACTPAVAAHATVIPAPAVDDTLAAKSDQKMAVFAGGCFWGIEEVYQHVRGVTDAVSGYAGGSARTARYEMVETGTSGHAESVKITYDPSKVTLGQLLKVFFSVAHDPTLLNRQGPDVGTQYRSAIFYSGERQQQLVTSYIEQLNSAGVFRSKIVTQVVPLTAFYPAEPDHQDYAMKNPSNPYILINDKPKVDELKLAFPALYK